MVPIYIVIHHLVFIMYAITIAHTFDGVQRSGAKARSQTFKWFSSTLLYYICDRAAMHLQHKYHTTIKAVSAITTLGSNDGKRMLLVKVKRPALFQFRPGQYAYLKVASIDAHWHPFSIASNPSSIMMEFYIEVCGDNTWTGKLWKLLDADEDEGLKSPRRSITIEIMGPYGSGLTKYSSDYSHVLAVGSGTGIVPLLSLYKQRSQN